MCFKNRSGHFGCLALWIRNRTASSESPRYRLIVRFWCTVDPGQANFMFGIPSDRWLGKGAEIAEESEHNCLVPQNVCRAYLEPTKGLSSCSSCSVWNQSFNDGQTVTNDPRYFPLLLEVV